MKKTLIFLISLSLSHSGFANIFLGGTRVIYNEKDKNSTILVGNSSKKITYLVQSWVEIEGDSSKKAPFLVTPPLFRLNGGEENTLRIVKTASTLPNDRESIFWLNVKAIPGVKKEENKNKLTIAVKNKIKLFYRPTALTGAASDAHKSIQFKQQGSALTISNSSNYYVTVNSIKSSGTEMLKVANMVAPRSQASVKLASTKRLGKINWTVVNDFGGITASESTVL